METSGVRVTTGTRDYNSSSPPDISVVIPTLNGFERLEALLPRLFSALAGLRTAEIVVVDDGSTESDRLLLQDLVDHDPRIVVIRHPRCAGQVAATLTGVSVARGEVVVTMDDDGGHPPEVIPRMVDALVRDPGISLVYATSRYTRRHGGSGRPVLRVLGTVLNNLLFHRFLGLPGNVPVGSFRAFRRDLLQRALREPVRYPYLSAMLLRSRPGVVAVWYRTYGIPVGVAVQSGRISHSRHRIRSLSGIWFRLVLYWGPLRAAGRLLRSPRVFVPGQGCA